MNLSCACIIPCFNEKDRIKDLINEISKLESNLIDWYLLDNGSNDTTYQIMINELSKVKLSNIFPIKKKKNNGYGAGLKYVINKINKSRESKKDKGLTLKKVYKYICWTHADGQTPINDVAIAHNIAIKQEKKFILIKGKRIQRKDGLLGIIFEFFLNLLVSLKYNKNILSAYSQPTLISKSLLLKISEHCPNDSVFDLAVIVKGFLHKATILRFPVVFEKRTKGKGSNESLYQKIKFSIDNLIYMLFGK